MADGTCYAILTAGVWEATLLTHRQVISARCKEGTGSSPAKGVPPTSLSFVKESEARVCSSPALISRSNDRIVTWRILRTSSASPRLINFTLPMSPQTGLIYDYSAYFMVIRGLHDSLLQSM